MRGHLGVKTFFIKKMLALGAGGGEYFVSLYRRSRGENILQNSASVLNFSKRAFCHASPTVWNSLPQTVISDLTVTTSTFKNRLKSALYCRAFLQ